MMTQTHILISTALWQRVPRRLELIAAMAGGIVPDAAIFALYAVEKFKGTAERVIWGEIYWQPFWQDVVAWGNSMPLYVILIIAGYFLTRIQTTEQRNATASVNAWGRVLFVLAGSCLVHTLCDFPVHHSDAHRHLFPLSSYKFISPVSYWDPQHHGTIFAVIESVLGIAIAMQLSLHFKSVLARFALGVLLVGYLALPTYLLLRVCQ